MISMFYGVVTWHKVRQQVQASICKTFPVSSIIGGKRKNPPSGGVYFFWSGALDEVRTALLGGRLELISTDSNFPFF